MDNMKTHVNQFGHLLHNLEQPIPNKELRYIAESIGELDQNMKKFQNLHQQTTAE